jgi:type IV pilus assembly protein PilA
MQGQPYGYGYAPQAPPPRSGGGFPTWALVLILTLGAFLILGIVVVVLAITGVRSYVAASKTAEATNSIGAIARASSAAYEDEDFTTGVARHRLCSSATHPVPVTIGMVSGMKYQSAASDWDGDANRGWQCLKFEMMAPQYYQYDYRMTGSGSAPGDGFTAIAHGDLDGDGVPSTFELDGDVTASKYVHIAPTPRVTNEKE